MSKNINAIGNDLKLDISQALNEWLNYRSGHELQLIVSMFDIDPMTDDKHDLGSFMDAILYYCNTRLSNSIEILKFINNDYKEFIK